MLDLYETSDDGHSWWVMFGLGGEFLFFCDVPLAMSHLQVYNGGFMKARKRWIMQPAHQRLGPTSNRTGILYWGESKQR